MTDFPALNQSRVIRRRLPKVTVSEPAIVMVFLVALTFSGGVFFRPVFLAWAYLVPPLAGAVLVAAFIAFLADHFKVGSAEASLLHLVASIATLPGLLALPSAKFGLPFPKAVGELFQALVHGPVRLLTTPIPARSGQSLLVVPVVAAWAGFVLGWVLYRKGRAGWSVLGPVFTLICALSFGISTGDFLLVTTGVFFALSLLYVVYLGRRTAAGSVQANPQRLGNRLPAMAVLVAICGASVGMGRVLPTVGRDQRFTFRQYRTPPFDPRDLASPLAEFSKYLNKDVKDNLLFTATGDLPNRWRLATLTSFDGRVWGVGSAQESASVQGRAGSDGSDLSAELGVFQVVGSRLQSRASIPNSTVASTTVRIDSLVEPWLPSTGSSLKLLPKGTTNLVDVRYNASSDTLVMPAGLAKGSEYGLSWAKSGQPDLTKLEKATAFRPAIEMPGSPNLDLIGKRANEIVGDGSDWEKVTRLQSYLKGGFYNEEAPPGHAYGDLWRILNDPNALDGNGEHYAALFGVLLRSVGIRSRVVVGFVPDAQRPGSTAKVQEVYGEDIRAWTEVAFEGVGWVPVDVEINVANKKPLPEKSKPRSTPDEPAKPPVIIPQAEPEEGLFETKPATPKTTVESAGTSWLSSPAVVGGGIVVSPLIVVLLTTAAVAFLKRRRRVRRQEGSPNQSVAGAWEEIVERSVEAGQQVAPNMTIAEGSAQLFSSDPKIRSILEDLSRLSEQAAYAAPGVDTMAQSQAWSLVDQFRMELRQTSTLWQRWKRLINPRPLSSGTRDRAYS
jgi:hypothetical protein